MRTLLHGAVGTVMALALSLSAFAAPPEDFTVKEPGTKNAFTLSKADRRYVVLHFLLKADSPECFLYTLSYASKMPNMENMVHVFLKPAKAEAVVAWKKKIVAAKPEETKFVIPPIYQDTDAKLARAYEIPGDLEYNGEIMHRHALVVLGPDRNEVFRFVGKDAKDRMPFQAFVRKVRGLAQGAAASQHNVGKNGVGLKGFDPVAYSREGKAVKGDPSRRATYLGVTYYFSTQYNRGLFVGKPAQYAPAYGGWDAASMAIGKKVEPDPRNFKVSNGRLFLFNRKFASRSRKIWDREEEGLIEKADAHWERLASGD